MSRYIIESILMLLVGATILGWVITGLTYLFNQTFSGVLVVIVGVLYLIYGAAKHKRFWQGYRKAVSIFFMITTSRDWN